ncbi:MAG TPA: helix-turn-helix domain-containing protein [Acidimicrobiales bacterium]|nr:helix-turn-helix domain-containing protein [Acidimicrobiales bacterium]
MGNWSFLTNHARALVYVSSHPDARLRDIAAELDVTERTTFAIVADLAEAGYVVKERDGRRNRYRIQPHLPLDDSLAVELTIGELLDLVNTERARRTRVRRSAG